MNCHSSESKSPLLTTFAIIFGIVLLVVGVLGFIPQLKTNGLLFGLLNVDANHNVIHIFFGLIVLQNLKNFILFKTVAERNIVCSTKQRALHVTVNYTGTQSLDQHYLIPLSKTLVTCI